MTKKNSYLTLTDQFCGAGGSSQGAREISKSMGGGLEIKLALNHWKLAIETHNTNFPDTIHECTDISACDPRRYPKTNILITSPECTNHSLAKGKKRGIKQDLFTSLDPAEERSRATMWDVPRFAEYHDYELIIVENVVDARYWVMWDAWLLAMHNLGYAHKCVYLNSMFCHPTPQSRDRMYVVFWKKGNKGPDLEYKPIAWCHKCEKTGESIQVWRNSAKQWGKYKQQYDYRCTCGELVEPFYYAAFNCIDWSLPAQRIGDRERPLATNTIKRIEYGLKKFGKDPLIITTRYTSGIECRVKHASSEPLPTQPGDQSHALLRSFILSSGYDHPPKAIEDFLSTVTTHANLGILQPYLIQTDHTKHDKCFSRNIDEPARSQTTAHSTGIVVPFITENRGTGKARSVKDQLGAVTAGGNPESFKAFLSYYYGNDQASSMAKPTGTFSTRDRASLVQHQVQEPRLEDCTYRMLKPHEIQSAMAFEKDYIVLGNSREKVKQLGNAVTPPAMKFLLGRGIESLKN